MPPYAPMMPPSGRKESNIVTIDVGGQIFQTTKQTLTLAGPKSLFSKILDLPASAQIGFPFIDRDPDLFSILLSLLRTGNLPSKAKAVDLQDLFSEAKFYGIESLLVSSLSNPSQFDAFNLEKSLILPLNGRDSPSAISTTMFGSVHVAHGSKITSFDWSLQRKSTILTRFSAVDSLLALSPSVAAAGATDFSGLQILDLENGRNSNSIVVFDIENLKPISEIGTNEIYGADLDSGIPATKLSWISDYNLLMASGSHSGPSGVCGNIKLWDVRSGNLVWELKEKVDCFSDVTVSENLSAIFKVGVNSGEVFLMDLRNLGAMNTWVPTGETRRVVNGKKEGVGCKIESHGNQVFCSKGGNLELWSEVFMGSTIKSEDGLQERVYRRNLMGRAKDMGGSRITHLSFGGNKMFVTRKDQQSVEVWQSSVRGF
ncbi:BTB/POZ domain-containing protein [Vitis vinifera]|uniref:BTB/POZ domain-containing protein n=1 Tax=Vitis vinifera TaxID=29760 RepID=A0A438BZS8_VITVI|nr:BTB/POZ domain-containing protein [Vitis vinifera]